MKRISKTTYFVVACFLFVTTIISVFVVNAANKPVYTISPIQEQNFQEFLQLLRTFESPQKDEVISLTIQIHEAMLKSDQNTVVEKNKVCEGRSLES